MARESAGPFDRSLPQGVATPIHPLIVTRSSVSSSCQPSPVHRCALRFDKVDCNRAGRLPTTCTMHNPLTTLTPTPPHVNRQSDREDVKGMGGNVRQRPATKDQPIVTRPGNCSAPGLEGCARVCIVLYEGTKLLGRIPDYRCRNRCRVAHHFCADFGPTMLRQYGSGRQKSCDRPSSCSSL